MSGQKAAFKINVQILTSWTNIFLSSVPKICCGSLPKCLLSQGRCHRWDLVGQGPRTCIPEKYGSHAQLHFLCSPQHTCYCWHLPLPKKHTHHLLGNRGQTSSSGLPFIFLSTQFLDVLSSTQPNLMFYEHVLKSLRLCVATIPCFWSVFVVCHKQGLKVEIHIMWWQE